MGFEQSIARIITALNSRQPAASTQQRQTVLLSATLTEGRLKGISNRFSIISHCQSQIVNSFDIYKGFIFMLRLYQNMYESCCSRNVYFLLE